MTQPRTTSESAIGLAIPLHPHEILMNLIVSLLAPMFLSISGGSVSLARMAATQTVNGYRASTHADLIAVAQVIGFGLAALSSLSQSMADEISPSMALRLRGNANALSRSAEQNRRSLQQTHSPKPAAAAAAEIVTDPTDALVTPAPERLWTGQPATIPNPAVAAKKLAAQTPTDETPADEKPADQTPADEKPADQTPAAETPADEKPADQTPADEKPADQTPADQAHAARTLTAQRRHQQMWAIAMVKEAAEITASIPGLPPSERQAATIRAAVLGSTANELLTGASLPPRPQTSHR